MNRLHRRASVSFSHPSILVPEVLVCRIVPTLQSDTPGLIKGGDNDENIYVGNRCNDDVYINWRMLGRVGC